MTDFSISFTLPFPAHELSPNARLDRRAKAGKVKAARDWGWLALRERAGLITAPDELRLCLEFHPPDKRHRDLDNLIASMKPYLDGVFDALGKNDNCIREIRARLSTTRAGGLVDVTLEGVNTRSVGWGMSHFTGEMVDDGMIDTAKKVIGLENL